jgi:hypothetical protein
MNEEPLEKKLARYVLELSARVRVLESSENKIKNAGEYSELLNSLFKDLKMMFELDNEIKHISK